MKKIRTFLKRFIILLIVIYAAVTFFNQQKILNTYTTSSVALDEQISEANKYNEELNELKENVNSEEYIEEMAREKLDMYMPNEKVYISNE